jgi:hypothetical protein
MEEQLGEARRTRPHVSFGGLRGEFAYEDDAFAIDPDLQHLFSGDGRAAPRPTS